MNQLLKHQLHMHMASLYGGMSKAKRAKVGAVLITNIGVVIPGYNGTPSGTDNDCEIETENGLVTRQEVIHAELNTILKCAKEGISCIGADLYVTLAPCKQCSAMIKQSGIRSVFYRDDYRDMQGVQYLKDNQVNVERI